MAQVTRVFDRLLRLLRSAAPSQTHADVMTRTTLMECCDAVEAQRRHLVGPQDQDQDRWCDWIHTVARKHALFDHMNEHDKLLSWRCVHKPRGYAGDAESLEAFLSKPVSVEHNLCHTSAAGIALTQRWHDMGHLLEHYAKAKLSKPSGAADSPGQFVALNVACGHFRELLGTPTFAQAHARATLVGFDQDAASLAHLNTLYPHVKTELGKIKQLFDAESRKVLQTKYAAEQGGFDLVWSAGLYDYLTDEQATRLTQHLFDMLIPDGGQLMIINALPGWRCRGWMEAMMDWWLVHRELHQMQSFAESIPTAQIRNIRQFGDTFVRYGYLMIEKDN